MSTSKRGPASGPALVGITAIAVLSGIVRATERILAGPDPFWHWDLGRRIVTSWLPASDPYSFLTDGRPWILNQWGTEAIVGVVDALGGARGVAVLGALLVAAAYGYVGWIMWRSCPSLTTVLLLGLVYMAGMSNLALRGNLFSFALTAAVLAELRRVEGPRSSVVGVLMVVWANLHAGFLLGLGLVLVRGLGELGASTRGHRATVARRWGRLLLVSTIATLITPYGPGLLQQVLSLGLRGSGSGISEWGAPSLLAPTVLPFTLLAAISLVAVAVTSGPRDLPDVLTVVAVVLFGASAIRNLAPAAIALGMLASQPVYTTIGSLRNRTPAPPGAVRGLDRILALGLAIVGIAGIAVLPPSTREVTAHVSGTPIDIVEALRLEDRPVRAHVTSLWAPSVAILGGDHVRTAVDGRLELFTAEEIQDSITIESARPGWLEQLDEWCITDVIVPSDSSPGVYLEEVDGWKRALTSPVLGSDEQEAIWYRRTGVKTLSTCADGRRSTDE